MNDGFRHVDGAQIIVFGSGAVGEAADTIDDDYTLLTTSRAAAELPRLVERAGTVIEVPHGRVEDTAATAMEKVGAGQIVALGGGRVIDTSKAVAAARRLRGPVAIPTSLSGAEMTGVHRHARGVPDHTPRVRASAVFNDPRLSASQPVDQLAASSANALGHAVTAVASTRSTPIARAVATDAAERIRRAWSGAEPHREQLALAALLSGWAVDRSGLGPHHALTQTAVRVASIGHAHANAALLPHTIRATRDRLPHATALHQLDATAENLRVRAGDVDLTRLTEDEDLLEEAVRVATRRPELSRVPPALTAEEIRRLYHAAGGA